MVKSKKCSKKECCNEKKATNVSCSDVVASEYNNTDVSDTATFADNVNCAPYMSMNETKYTTYDQPKIQKFKGLPRVKAVVPLMSSVLVELVNENELISGIIIAGQEKPNYQQGYVLDIPQGIKDNNWAVKVGDRVMINSRSTLEVPNYDNNPRKKILVELHDIKAILKE